MNDAEVYRQDDAWAAELLTCKNSHFLLPSSVEERTSTFHSTTYRKSNLIQLKNPAQRKPCARISTVWNAFSRNLIFHFFET